MTQHPNRNGPPAFNLEPVIVIFIAIFVIVHILRAYFIPESLRLDFVLLVAAIPARYGELGAGIPYAIAAWYTPVTHMFVHADWGHLIFNTLWMMAFGSPIARRLGMVRFFVFSFAGALCGFAFHLFTHIGDFTPVIGASGAVSAYMAGAIRLQRDVTKPVLSLLASLQNRGFLAFVIVWFLLNLLVGLYPEIIGTDGAQIAWQAHIGGFVSGMLLIKFIDPAANKSQNFD